MSKKSIREKCYPYYKKFYRINLFIEEKFTKSGIALLAASGLFLIFGMNTQKTMFYQIFAIIFGFFSISFLFTLFFTPKLEIKRKLPEFCIAGKELRYQAVIKNKKNISEKSLFIREFPSDPRPSLYEFLSSKEPGEEKRNKFDQKFSFYRWKWLIEKKAGAEFCDNYIESLNPGEEKAIEMTFTPKRRGVIYLEKVRVFYNCPFSLMKSGKYYSAPDSITVLPEIFPVPEIKFLGNRKYQREKSLLSLKTGDSMEFAGVREFMQGDQLKHIDWKLFAKHQKPVVRQYFDEFSSYFVIIVDNIGKNSWFEPLEKALSTAASIFVSPISAESSAGIIYAAKENFIFSRAENFTDTTAILKEIASIESVDTSFVLFGEFILSFIQEFSSAILLITQIDDERAKFIAKIRRCNTAVRVILTAENKEDAEKIIKEKKLEGIVETSL